MANDLIEIGINVRSNAQAATRGLDRLEGSVSKNLRAAERLEREYKRLDRAFNNNKISAQTYARGVQQVDRAIEGLWKETDRATQATERLRNATNRSMVQQNQFGIVADANTRKFKRFGAVGLQQVGYQVGDFAVQLQGGTNAAVALGQQGSQLLGIFGPFGAIMGAVLAVVTAFAAPMLDVAEAGGVASQEFSKLTNSLKPIEPLLKAIRGAFSALKEIAIDAVNLIANNLGRLVAIAGTAAALFGGKFLAGFVASRVATLSLSAALVTLRGALIKTGIGAAVVFAGELVYQFTRLVAGAGSFGEAMKLLGDVAAGVWTGIVESAKAIPPALESTWERVKSSFYNFLSKLTEAWSRFLGNLGADLSGISVFGKNPFQGVADSISEASAQAVTALSEYDAEAQKALSASTSLASEAGSIVTQGFSDAAEAVDALKQAIANADSESEKFDLRKVLDQIAKSSEAAGKAGSEAGKKIEEAAEKSKTALEEAYITSEEFAELWKNQVVDGIESVSSAFTDFIMNGFRNFEDFADAIKATFRNLIATLIQTAVQNQIVIPIVASVTGGGGGISSLLGGGGGGGGGLLGNIPGGGGGLLGTIGGGIASLGSNLVTGGSAVAGGFLQGLGGVVGQGLSGIGASFGSLGGILSGSVGIGGGSMASAIGAALPAVGVIVAGISLIAKGFEKQTDSWEVITGSITNMDANLSRFGMIKEYSAFSSSTDYYSIPIGGGQLSSFVQGVQQVQQGAMEAAETLGVAADTFDNFSFTIDAFAPSLSSEITRMGDAFARMVPGISSLNELIEVANGRYQLQNQVLQLLGREEELLARQRKAQLEATHELNRPALQSVFNLQDAQIAVQNAFAALRRSIDETVNDLRDKLNLANNSLQESRRVFNLIARFVDRRQIEGAGLTDSIFRRSRESSLSFLRGGDVSDERALQNALQIVSEPTEGLFGSFVDYARDFYTTSNVIKDLEDKAGAQLSADERTVANLETQIEQANNQYQLMVDQYNALLGIEEGVLSIPEAIERLRGALELFARAQETAKEETGLPDRSNNPEMITSKQQFVDFAKSLGVQVEGRTGRSIMNEILLGDYGVSRISSLPSLDLRRQQFAKGGYFPGGMRMVGEEGPELEVTGPSRIFSREQTSQMFRDPELANEVRSLRSEVANLRSENNQLQANNNKYTKRSYDLYRKWDIEGIPAERT